jgi:branched-subunit amino acid transport protein
MWAAVLLGSAGCYVLKLAGMSVPQRVLDDDRVRRIGALLPVALLSALVATQTFATGHDLTVDARAAGLVVAVAAVLARAPFLAVVAGAAATTALVRAVS